MVELAEEKRWTIAFSKIRPEFWGNLLKQNSRYRKGHGKRRFIISDSNTQLQKLVPYGEISNYSVYEECYNSISDFAAFVKFTAFKEKLETKTIKHDVRSTLYESDPEKNFKLPALIKQSLDHRYII